MVSYGSRGWGVSKTGSFGEYSAWAAGVAEDQGPGSFMKGMQKARRASSAE